MQYIYLIMSVKENRLFGVGYPLCLTLHILHVTFNCKLLFVENEMVERREILENPNISLSLLP